MIATILFDTEDYSRDDDHSLDVKAYVAQMFPFTFGHNDNGCNDSHDLAITSNYSRNDGHSQPVKAVDVQLDHD